MAFPGDYTKYQEVTIDATKVSADLTDYVVYVNLADLVKAGADIFDTCRSDGGDIRVTKTDGITQLAVELVAIDTTAKTGELHFKFTGTLSSSTDTVIRIWYNGADTVPAVSSTYGRNNVWTDFQAVFHFNQDPSAGSLTDSTGNGYNGTAAGSMTSGDLVAGKFGKAWDFDGANDRVTLPTPTAFQTAIQSVSAYVQSSAPNTLTSLFSVGDLSSPYNKFAHGTGGGMYKRTSNTTGPHLTPTVAFSNDTWTHYAGNIETNDYRVYKDGVANGVDTTDGRNPLGMTGVDTAEIASLSYNGTATSYPAIIDELRIRTSSISGNYVSTEYNNQNTPSTFYASGDEEGGVITQALTATAQAGASYAKQIGKEVAVTAQMTASFLRSINKRITATAQASTAILKTLGKSLAVTARATVTIMTTQVTLKILTATAQANTSLTKISINTVELIVTAAGAVTVTTQKAFNRLLTATAQGTASLVQSGLIISRELLVVARATVTIPQALTLSKILTATASAVVSLARDFGFLDKYPENEATYEDKYPEQ